MDDEVMENGLTKEVDLTFRYTEKSYSFTHCREKAHISGGKRWTQIVNGQKALKDDVFIALLLAFYLGIDSVEEFLNCFGISLNSPCEHVNSVPMSDIKKAIQAGIHYDNIIYYLRETKE